MERIGNMETPSDAKRKSGVPSDQREMLPWEDTGQVPSHDRQNTFYALWWTPQDLIDLWAVDRAKHLAQAALKVQMDRLAYAGEDEGATGLAGADCDIVEDP